MRAAQLLAGVDAPALAPEPLSVAEPGTGQVRRHPRPPEALIASRCRSSAASSPATRASALAAVPFAELAPLARARSDRRSAAPRATSRRPAREAASTSSGRAHDDVAMSPAVARRAASSATSYWPSPFASTAMAYSATVIAHPSPRACALLVISPASAEATEAWPRKASSCSGMYGRVAARVPGMSAVTRVLLEGDRATVETRAGAYEVEERDGRWQVARLEPVVRVLAGGPADEHPVGMTVVRPRLAEPALGPALAGRTDKASIELTGTLEPEDARLEAEPSPGTRVRRVEARDGRFRVELDLRPGRNEVLLRARAPGRAPTELAVRLTRE